MTFSIGRYNDNKSRNSSLPFYDFVYLTELCYARDEGEKTSKQQITVIGIWDTIGSVVEGKTMTRKSHIFTFTTNPPNQKFKNLGKVLMLPPQIHLEPNTQMKCSCVY